jgi:hypothetical protein
LLFGAQTHEQCFVKFCIIYRKVFCSPALVRADLGDYTNNQTPHPPLEGAVTKTFGIFDQNKTSQQNFEFGLQIGFWLVPLEIRASPFVMYTYTGFLPIHQAL